MPAAARGRFESPGKRLQLFRQYNVSVDTGAFEICRSRPRAPDVSTLQSVEERAARASTCTHRPYHAYPCVHFLCGGVLAPALPSPSPHCTLLDICMHYAASGRLEHERITLQAYECAHELKTRAQPDSFAVTGVHVCTCTYRNMPHAYGDTSQVRMTQQAYACATERIPHVKRAFAPSL